MNFGYWRLEAVFNLSLLSEAQSESFQISKMESLEKIIKIFYLHAPSYMFDKVLKTPVAFAKRSDIINVTVCKVFWNL